MKKQQAIAAMQAVQLRAQQQQAQAAISAVVA